jgi:hypothetical protein
VIVVAHTRQGLLNTVQDEVNHDAALRHGRQPREEVLVLVTEVHVAGAGAPRRHLPGKVDVQQQRPLLDVDAVLQRLTPLDVAEGVRADGDVTPVGGRVKTGHVGLGLPLAVQAARAIELDRHEGRQALADALDERLRIEHHDQGAAVVEVGVEVPPFVGVLLARGAHPVLTTRDRFWRDAEGGVVLRPAGGSCSTHGQCPLAGAGLKPAEARSRTE